MKALFARFFAWFRRAEVPAEGRNGPKTAPKPPAGYVAGLTPIRRPETAATRARVDAQIAEAVERRRHAVRANLASSPTPARTTFRPQWDDPSERLASERAAYSESAPVSTAAWDALSATGSASYDPPPAPTYTPQPACTDTTGDWSHGSSGSSCMDWGSSPAPSPSTDSSGW